MDIKDSRRFKIDFQSKEGLIRVLYAFVHNPDLTNPEVTFFTGQDDTGDAQKLSFSRNSESDDKKLPDEKKWQELASLTDLEGIMCVAGTNKADTRRVVVLYVPRAEFEKSVIISFPNTVNGRLNSREVRVLRFFDALPESISQFGGKNYFIIHGYVSNDRTDYNTLIPVLEKHRKAFGEELKEVTADSGYCSEKNLLYLKEQGIASYIKLQDHEQRKTRAYREDIGKYYNMQSQVYEDEHYYVCHDGREITAYPHRE